MPYIRLDLTTPIVHKMTVAFRSPANCSDVSGLAVYSLTEKNPVPVHFDFVDLFGEILTGSDLFAPDVIVKVILDTNNHKAFIQSGGGGSGGFSTGSGTAPQELPSFANESRDVSAVAHGGGVTVVLYGNGLYGAYSTDKGKTWKDIVLPVIEEENERGWDSIVYGGGYFVAVSKYGSRALHSKDGINWVVSQMPYYRWDTIAYGNDKFIALGYDSEYGRAHIATSIGISDDTLTWGGRVLPSEVFTKSMKLAFGDNYWVAMESENPKEILNSTDDCLTWNVVSDVQIPSGFDCYHLVYTGEAFFAGGIFGGESEAMYSLDGESWTVTNLPSFDGSIKTIYHLMSGGGKIVCSTWSSQDIAWSSDLGATWHLESMKFPNENYIGFDKGAYLDDRFLLVHRGGSFFALSDTEGLNWKIQEGKDFSDLFFKREKVTAQVANALAPYINSPKDVTVGTTREQLELPEEIDFQGAAIYYEGKHIVLAAGEAFGFYSTDHCKTWHRFYLPCAGNWTAVERDVNRNHLIAIDSNMSSHVIVTTDEEGLVWKEVTLPKKCQWFSIAGDFDFLISGKDENDVSCILRTTNYGDTWSEVPSPGGSEDYFHVASCIHGNSYKFFAVSEHGNAAYVSDHGTSWESMVLPSGLTSIHSLVSLPDLGLIALPGNSSKYGAAMCNGSTVWGRITLPIKGDYATAESYKGLIVVARDDTQEGMYYSPDAGLSWGTVPVDSNGSSDNSSGFAKIVHCGCFFLALKKGRGKKLYFSEDGYSFTERYYDKITSLRTQGKDMTQTIAQLLSPYITTVAGGSGSAYTIEFGTLEYNSSATQELTFNFSQAYKRPPVFIPYVGEDNLKIKIEPLISTSGYYGGKVIVTNTTGVNTSATVAMSAYCSEPSTD